MRPGCDGPFWHFKFVADRETFCRWANLLCTILGVSYKRESRCDYWKMDATNSIVNARFNMFLFLNCSFLRY